MKSIDHLAFAVAIAAMLSAAPSPSLAQDPSCVVATVQPLATEAGLQAYRNGGNALDAAVAAALTLGVVDSHNSGIGGGCFILIRSPDGSLTAIDGRETAPAAATADMFVREGQVQPGLSTTGALAIAVPGALAAYSLAIEQRGNLPLSDLLVPAAELADRGFTIDQLFATNLRNQADKLAKFEGSRAVFLNADGTPLRQGATLRQPDLARSYRAIAEQGIDWFYRGPFAESVHSWMTDHGGLLTAADFAAYRPIERTPILSSYRGWQIVGFPPPSSGGVHVAEMLNMLETFDLKSEQLRDPVAAAHLIIESMKLAFADRAHWLGDADFADVPKALVAKEYGRSLARRIRADRASDVAAHGDPLAFEQDFFYRHTTHVAAADSEGYWVAITATINTHYGSKVIVPGTGVVLNNEMDDFSSQPGVPNAFGLVGAENNAIVAGKRPLSSMSPTIVLDANGNPVLTVGAAGGPKIITQVLLTIIRSLDFGQSLSEAVSGPRFHHQWRPDSVLVEKGAAKEWIESLKEYGHEIRITSGGGVTQAVGLDDSGSLIGVHDPRVPGKVGHAHRPVRTTSAPQPVEECGKPVSDDRSTVDHS